MALYKEGLAFMEQGQYERAKRKFHQSIQSDDTYLAPLEEIKKCRKLSRKKNKEIKKH